LVDGSIGFEQLCADHSPTNVDEYIRMAQLSEVRSPGWEPAICAYDAEVGSMLEIFQISDEGEVDLDRAMVERLDELNVGFKTARGDRPTAIFVPETEAYGQQKLAVTRSLGDIYMQHHGATWEPTVSCIDLFDVAGQLDQVTLVLGSDGLWDLWAYKELLEYTFKAGLASTQSSVVTSLNLLVEVSFDLSETRFAFSLFPLPPPQVAQSLIMMCMILTRRKLVSSQNTCLEKMLITFAPLWCGFVMSRPPTEHGGIRKGIENAQGAVCMVVSRLHRHTVHTMRVSCHMCHASLVHARFTFPLIGR